jgi:uncharacterized protein (UPF0248 family)
MQRLQDLLHRIQWDPDFGKGTFALGYRDRTEERIVPFASVTFDPRQPGFFAVEDADGVLLHVPLHRVRTVYRDDVVIWQRPRSNAPG